MCGSPVEKSPLLHRVEVPAHVEGHERRKHRVARQLQVARPQARPRTLQDLLEVNLFMVPRRRSELVRPSEHLHQQRSQTRTPAMDESAAAKRMTRKPVARFATSEGSPAPVSACSLALLTPLSCTTATPTLSMARPSHLLILRVRPIKQTENTPDQIVFVWYATLQISHGTHEHVRQRDKARLFHSRNSKV